MSQYNSLKATIDANIYANHEGLIRGDILNSVLNQMVSTLGMGYQFVGIATPATNPGSPDAKVFYIANGKGTYSNFGGLEVTEDNVVILYWDSAWHKMSSGVASAEGLNYAISELADFEILRDWSDTPMEIAGEFEGYARDSVIYGTSRASSVYYKVKKGKMYRIILDNISGGGAGTIDGVFFCREIPRNNLGETPIFTYGAYWEDIDETITAEDDGYLCVSLKYNAVVFNVSYSVYSKGDVIDFPSLIKEIQDELIAQEETFDTRVKGIISSEVYDGDVVENDVTDVQPGFYNGETLEYVNNPQFYCAKVDAENYVKVSYDGIVRYSLLWAVIFADENGVILGKIGHNDSQSEHVSTGIVDIPAGTKYIYFGSYSSQFTAKVYSNPVLINEVNIKNYIPETLSKTKYVDAYHYIFGNNVPEDIVSSGFDSSYSSSISGSYVIHDKYFKSYRRKHEWIVELSASSIVKFGTGNSNSAIEVSSRQSQFVIDVPASLLRILTSEGTPYATAQLGTISAGQQYVVRYSQYDYTQKVEVINVNTLGIVAEYTSTATPQNSPTGKILGKPFIQLQSGFLKVVSYDCFLMYKPTIVFVGDSITECGYRQHTYAGRFIEGNINNDGCIVAQGGATSGSMGLSKESELVYMKPKYLSLLAGTNGTITESDIEGWKSFCEENGIIFILNRVPVSKTPATYPWESKNATIRSMGIIGANFDYATALHNNPSDGADSSLFGDDVHPNEAGQIKMLERFIADVQII